MPNVQHIGLVTESKGVKVTDLAPAAAALQTQVIRDVEPVWKRRAVVTAYAKLEDLPLDAWPVLIRDDISFDAQGIHLDQDGHPFSLVLYSSGWTLTSSHECLEMLCDPMGKRTRKAPSIKPDQGDARYLVEVCDPSESKEFAYEINAVTVSDFYFPSYFDVAAKAGHHYSFTGAITAPRQVLRGGYLSWQDVATKHWWQQTWFGSQPVFRDLGVATKGTSPRRFTDGATKVPAKVVQGGRPSKATLATAAGAGVSRDARAVALRSQVRKILHGAG